MARPKKEGLDYFPLDVDIDQDDKIALIEAKHGLEGFAVVVRLFMKIYKNSYYYEWSEKEQLLFSKRVNVNINSLNDIIKDCLQWGVFDQEVFNACQILTSKGIQTRYLDAISRRKEVILNEKYLLVDAENLLKGSKIEVIYVNADKKRVNVDINSNKDVINPQSKVKESKVKKNTSHKQVYDESSIHYRLAKYLYDGILQNNPHHKKPNLQEWSNHIRLMMDRDSRTEEQIRETIDYSVTDDFWSANVLSTKKLREKFDTLTMQMKKKKPSFKQPNKTNVSGYTNVDDLTAQMAKWEAEASGGM